ncbi:MAG: aldo/keto reductase, partial [Cyanophyceae cyanobacterium]
MPPTDLISLGSTDIQVSPLGIGTWAWGDKVFWGYGSGYGETDLAQVFSACLDAGINFFDTAEIYGLGQSEKL